MGRVVDDRSRSWMLVVYPDDSLPPDYVSILSDEFHLTWVESPLHDADVNGDLTEKKKHIHIFLSFDGNKSFEQVKEISDRLHAPIPKRVINVRGFIRYMVHLDNPEKHQYSIDQIKVHGGFDIEPYFKASSSECRQILKELLQLCIDNEISDFCTLTEIVFASKNEEWLEILTSRNTMFLSAYLKSKHFYLKELKEQSQGT